LLEPFGITQVNLWSLDTEGAKLAILNTVDWTRFCADIVIIEATLKGQQERNAAKRALMKTVGYVELDLRAQNLLVTCAIAAFRPRPRF
jgi:hypothetical protein